MVTGIEITTNVLRVAILNGAHADRPPQHTIVVPMETPATEAEGIVAALSAAIGRVSFSNQPVRPPVAVAVPSSWCHYRLASFPFRRSLSIDGALPYALESRVPGAIEDYVIEPLSDRLPAGRRGARVLLAACSRARVEQVIEAFARHGLDPCLIQPAPVALARFTLPAGARKGRTVLVVRVDDDGGDVVLARDGEVVACRALPPRRGAADAEAVVREVDLALRCWSLDGIGVDIDRALTLAPADLATELAAPLQALLQRPVDVPDDAQERALWAAARGAAAAVSDHDKAITLRRGKLVYAPHARRQERKTGAPLAAAVAIVVAFCVWMGSGIADARARLEAVRAEQAAAFHRVVPAPNVPPSQEAMRAALTGARKEAQRRDPGNQRSCVQTWVEVLRHVPPGTRGDLAIIDIGQSGVRLEGHARTIDDVWELRKRLATSAMFSPNPPTFTQNPKKQDISFSIELRYR